MRNTACLITLGLVLLTGCEPSFEHTASEANSREIIHGWPEYGGGDGAKYFAGAALDKSNVGALEVAWVHKFGDVSDGDTTVRDGVAIASASALEVTPITAEGKLIFCTPFNRVVALDPLTGGELWQFDPQIDLSGHYANSLVCRGVAYWQDEATAGSRHCSSRIFTATNDGYLHAIDTATGKSCEAFGDEGRVNLNRGVGDQEWLGEYQVTSAPTVINNLVIVGSAISDNSRIDAPSGVIRAFDATTGKQQWANDLAPPAFDYENGLVSEEGFALGTPNVWGTMTADEERDLVFIPTGNPAPDYYRSGTRDMDYYGTAVVALHAATGDVAWHFNTVINDYWDFDVGAQPTLADITINNQSVPVVIQGTKMGFVFVLHRDTGEPVIDIDYQSVPQEGPLKNQLSPVQPFPPEAFRVAAEVTPEDEWKLLRPYTSQCSDMFETSRTGPIYTPITEEWTIVAPGNAGGINWGGVAVDPVNGLIATRASHLPFRVRLVPRDEFSGDRGSEFEVEHAEQRGTPYAMYRMPFTTDDPLPCVKPPWGYVTLIDIGKSEQTWRIPHGTLRDVTDLPLIFPWGAPGVGAPIITSTGLVFLAAGMENAIRAYDIDNGRELWHHRLPAGPQATPMSYTLKTGNREKQFVVIAAGGHGGLGTKMGDYIVAFSIPDDE
jgi:quinoprotein glucose dehydrogenase